MKKHRSIHFYPSLCLLLLLGLCSVRAMAYEPRNLLQKLAGPDRVKESLLPREQWIKYPAYSDRAGWERLTGPLRQQLIADGEAMLGYQWKVVNATDYLEYERTGNRQAMEQPFGENNRALSRLVFAELTEGKGRFIDQIINGIWHTCNMPSWSLSAHLPAQKTKRSLPDYHEQIIDLTSGDLGSFLSWTWYFFHERFDEVDPIIANRLKHLIRERILDPYMQRSDYWWQAFNYHPGVLVNNWNPWCNSNVLLCNLLLEDDKDKLAKAVYRTMQSVDEFINYVKSDGACEEGSSYWGHAAGKLYDYLQILSDASGGKLSLLHNPMIRRMGEYIARSYVGNGWVVNFADASAKGGGEPGLIYRYGKATGSEMMQHFAAYLFQQQGGTEHWSVERDFFRSVENIISLQELQHTSPALPDDPATWYPETEVCYIRNSAGYFLAAKGGNNNESHNHNDVGSFSLYINQQPVFIDAGVGTYTRQTFSSERYKIWTMQSNYHNLPMINGMQEQFGATYRASDVSFDSAHDVFKLNIAGAYPKDAAVEYWKRQYQLDDRQGLLIKDEFKLSEAKEPIVQHFMTRNLPDISKKGIVLLTSDGATTQMQYDPAQWDASVDEIPQTDSRLSRVWGKAIYRLVLTAKKKGLKGRYLFRISKL